ncbi:MAG: efflux RND transporter periplasmic adaptor subunit [bacterium]|nr:efflux RND transporter periplasmic adaptor subunit [bacterium]
MQLLRVFLSCGLLTALVGLSACAGDVTKAENAKTASPGRGEGHGRGPGGMRGGSFPGGMPGSRAEATAAVPVEVMTVARRPISEHLETNGVLEAENEVDVVARISGPIVELLVEEGMEVKAGQILARIDDEELRAQVEIAAVNRDEAKLAFERARLSFGNELISQEAYDQTKSRLESMRAQLKSYDIQLGYTQISAPFDGLIVERYVKLAQHLSNGTRLFRISDFKPLLCPIRVPEKDLSRLRIGQPGHIEVEAFAETRFDARVLRISPVVDSATGTVKVTLEVDAQGKLRPGMFASVFLETDRHDDALVIPRTALVLDSLGDTVYVDDGGTAARREVRLGFREADLLEVLEGIADGEQIVVLGQDSLSDGTPITVLAATGPAEGPPGRGQRGRGPRPDFSQMTSERLEMMKERMRSRGMSEEQIEERLEQMRERFSQEPPPQPPSPPGR